MNIYITLTKQYATYLHVYYNPHATVLVNNPTINPQNREVKATRSLVPLSVSVMTDENRNGARKPGI